MLNKVSDSDELPYWISDPWLEPGKKDEGLLIVPCQWSHPFSLLCSCQDVLRHLRRKYVKCQQLGSFAELLIDDFKYFVAPGFGSSWAFNEHITNAFDTMYEEGEDGRPGLVSLADPQRSDC